MGVSSKNRVKIANVLVFAVMLIACSFMIMMSPGTSAASVSSSDQITLIDQDYSLQSSVPSNMVIGNHQQDRTDATLIYNTAAKAVEYKTIGSQTGFLYVGIEPIIDGNLAIRMKVVSDGQYSNTYIVGSTFWLQTLTLPNGQTRVASYYQTSEGTESAQYYDVPSSSLVNDVNIINIMISGTARTVTVYFDSAHSITTPMYSWTVQKLPYSPITLPMVAFMNEKSWFSTWVATQLYGIRQTVSGGLVSAVPGNDHIPFGIDYPRENLNQEGTAYMTAAGQKGVAWADMTWLNYQPGQIAFIQSLLDTGWELGIHYDDRLIDMSNSAARAFMKSEYDQVTSIFGQPPTSWCSYQNADNVNHAAYAYQELGMIWRNGYSGVGYLPNIGNLHDDWWPGFWSKISAANICIPSFTHATDEEDAQPYSIGLENFKDWVDNYASKSIIGFDEYYHRIANQVDTEITYIGDVLENHFKFSVACNEFETRLLINVAAPDSATLIKDGAILTNGVGYTIENGRIALYASSGSVIEVTTRSVPSAPYNFQGIAGDGHVDLSWRAPLSDGGKAITGYNLYRGEAIGEESLLVPLGPVLSYVDNTVVDGQTYYYVVAAVNSNGEGARSVVISATPDVPGVKPSAPLNLTATADDARVTLNWEAPLNSGSSAVTEYWIYRGTTPGEGSLIDDVSGATSFVDTGLTNGQTYYYRVSAVNSAGESERSNEAVAAPSAPSTVPSVPLDLAASGGDDHIDLTWSMSSSNGGSTITGFNVYRGTISGGETLLASIGNVTSYRDSDVASGIIYYYKVSAINDIGESQLSNEASSTLAVPTEFSYTLINGGTEVEITGYTGSSEIVSLPSSIDGKTVTSIGSYAFYGRSTITSVTIPDSVRSIGTYAFTHCTSIATVTMLGPVDAIGEAAFYGCSALASVNMQGGIGTIGDWAFSRSGLRSVVIPDGTVNIGSFAFNDCSYLTSVVIPNTVVTIRDYVFTDCSSLKSIILPEGLRSIGNYTFYSCTALTSLTIPGTVQSIGDYAFYTCTAMTSITIPSSLAAIGGAAFYGCSDLTAMYFDGNAPVCEGWWIGMRNAGLIIYYHDTATGFTTPTWEGVPTRTY